MAKTNKKKMTRSARAAKKKGAEAKAGNATLDTGGRADGEEVEDEVDEQQVHTPSPPSSPPQAGYPSLHVSTRTEAVGIELATDDETGLAFPRLPRSPREEPDRGLFDLNYPPHEKANISLSQFLAHLERHRTLFTAHSHALDAHDTLSLQLLEAATLSQTRLMRAEYWEDRALYWRGFATQTARWNGELGDEV